MSSRVVVGMSGGVDSAVAARVLQDEGCEVIGAFLALRAPVATGESRCCSDEDLADARRIAEVLGIELREQCASRAFFDVVFSGTVDAYAAGRTPSPCVVCNERVKFAELERVARAVGADAVATGHYARVEAPGSGPARLFVGYDRAKDQSYFLHRLSGERLRSVRFPLGGLTKDRVRELARGAGVGVARKRESQELCFVPRGTSYADLVARWRPDRVSPGMIVDGSGRRLGHHEGVHRYTVGQRRGLAVAAGRRVYVTAIDADTGTIVVGDEEALETAELAVGGLAWIADGPPSERFRASVRVRARHPGAAATVIVGGDRALVVPDRPVRAVAPGQAAVFYRGDEVLGGGWILPDPRRLAQ